MQKAMKLSRMQLSGATLTHCFVREVSIDRLDVGQSVVARLPVPTRAPAQPQRATSECMPRFKGLRTQRRWLRLSQASTISIEQTKSWRCVMRDRQVATAQPHCGANSKEMDQSGERGVTGTRIEATLPTRRAQLQLQNPTASRHCPSELSVRKPTHTPCLATKASGTALGDCHSRS